MGEPSAGATSADLGRDEGDVEEEEEDDDDEKDDDDKKEDEEWLESASTADLESNDAGRGNQSH